MKIASIRRSFAFRTTLVLAIALIWVLSALNVGAAGPSENEPGATGGVSTTPSVWVPTGSLHVPRWGYTATRLLDGSVLVAGGVNRNGAVISGTELYDPATGTWRDAAPLGGIPAIPRAGHTATLLQSGKVLVVGGSGETDAEGPNGTAEIYDPATGAWAPTGRAVAGGGGAATLLRDGRVLVTGGGSAELYDPATGTWALAAAPIRARYGHTATLLRDGKVLVVGGLVAPSGFCLWDCEEWHPNDAEHELLQASTAELYDPGTGTWSAVGEPMVIHGHTATLLLDGQVLIAGGFSAKAIIEDLGAAFDRRTAARFEPATFAWRDVGPQNQSYADATASRLSDGKVLLIGATVAFDVYGNPTLGDSAAEIYDPAAPAGTNPWSTVAKPHTPRSGHTATLLADGNVLVVGMLVTGRTLVGDAEVFRYSGNTTSPTPAVAPVIEYYDAALDHYFITASAVEIEALDAGRVAGWARTGRGFQAWTARDARPDLLDVCRLYIPPADGDSHFYSASAAECAAAQAQHPEFILETPSAFMATLPQPQSGACPTGLAPVYRLWNARADSNHRFTTSSAVRSEMLARGYVAEGHGPDGVVMCVAASG
jgi:hypothetical protein